jgi:hypothetical protein
MTTKTLRSIISCTAIALLSISCGNKDKETTGTPGAGASPGAASGPLQSVIAAVAPDGALSVVAARAAAQPGEAIVLRGKVGGKFKPISDTAAILVLADETAIKSCDETADDECETPWDYCCEEASTIAASTATIQVMGDDGKLLRSTLRGVGDIKELSHLVIAGTVDPTSTPEALIVNADKIHIEKP